MFVINWANNHHGVIIFLIAGILTCLAAWAAYINIPFENERKKRRKENEEIKTKTIRYFLTVGREKDIIYFYNEFGKLIGHIFDGAKYRLSESSDFGPDYRKVFFTMPSGHGGESFLIGIKEAATLSALRGLSYESSPSEP